MNQKSKTSSFLFIIIAFVFGLIIGLVVLGWWLWPVNYTGGSFDTLNSVDQQNFLRAAIEAYAYNPDAAIAQERFAALGDQKEKILSDILANPGNMEKTDVEQFANAIKTAPAIITTTEVVATSAPTAAPAKSVATSILSVVFNRPSWMEICLPVGMLVVVVLVILMVFLSRRNKRSVKAGGELIEPMEPEDAAVFAEISSQGQSGEVQPEGAKTFGGVRC